MFFLVSSCSKTEVVDPAAAATLSASTPGGIALTFDDYSVDNWHNYLSLLDSFNVKATFYISNYNKLTSAQKNKLRQLQQHGNEIAFHSTNHVNFLKYADSNKCDKLMQEEVEKGLKLMNDDGFTTTTFAYPYGKHNEILDKLLLKSFKSVRALNGSHDLSKSLSPLSGNKILYGLGIDESSKRDLGKIKDLISLAQQKNKCAVLLIHNIERPAISLQLPLWKLREVLEKVKSLNLKYYTVSEISQ
jgi:peptidoglycan/xylan/chitin deacetylase (PgdA/CDA1 family)